MTSPEIDDTGLAESRPGSAPPAKDGADDRWEDEGGAMAHKPAPGRSVPLAPLEVNRFGQGQIARTITQDEQDRLATRS